MFDPNEDSESPELAGPAPTPSEIGAPGMGGGMDICVPVASLAQSDEQDQMQPPTVGDPVTMTVEGKISRIEGGNAYVTPSAVNGQEVQQPASPMDEASQLRDMAAGMGNQQY